MSRGLAIVTAQTGTPTSPTTPFGTASAVDAVGEFLPPWIPPEAIQLVLALLVLIVSYYVSKYGRQVFGRRIARRFQRPSVTRTVLRSVQTLVLLVGVVVALQILGFPLGNLALSVTVFSAVAGFVLAPIIGSVINGVFILSEQPYEIGDMIQLSEQDVYGFVEDITLRYTKMFTLDNTFLIIPNGSIRERDVVNFSAEDSRTRLTLDIEITYESDIDIARQLVEKAASDVEAVIKGGPDIRIGSARYPAQPTCYIDSFASHGVNLRLRYWVDDPYKLLQTRSRVQSAAWDLLQDADVEIAYPHNHLHFDDTSGELEVNLSRANSNTNPGMHRNDQAGPGKSTETSDPD
jgi:small-conductance mechanosensitive channel